MEKICENCNAFLEENKTQGFCRANPPVPVFMGFRQGLESPYGQPNNIPMVTSYFPQMLKTGSCRQWQKKE